LSSCQLKNDPDSFSPSKLLGLQAVAQSSRIIQGGTFLAAFDFEESMSMTDSHIQSSKRTIMVVDDDPELVTIVQLMLEDRGFNVRCAYSGKDLFASLKEQMPDLILLDIMMPRMDGLEVLKQLKGNPDTASIPVIMLTAKVLHVDILEGYKMGADYYITKPFTNTQLLTGINLLLSGSDTLPSPPMASA
jgi:CheY-like chemotaxis protein